MEAENGTAASRRLAAVMVRCRRCEWYPYVRMGIAVPFWAVARVATTGVAGGEREIAAVTLSDDNGTAVCPA